MFPSLTSFGDGCAKCVPPSGSSRRHLSLEPPPTRLLTNWCLATHRNSEAAQDRGCRFKRTKGRLCLPPSSPPTRLVASYNDWSDGGESRVRHSENHTRVNATIERSTSPLTLTLPLPGLNIEIPKKMRCERISITTITATPTVSLLASSFSRYLFKV